MLGLLLVSLPARGQADALRYELGVPTRPVPGEAPGGPLATAGIPIRTSGQVLEVSDMPPKGIRLPAFTSRHPRFLTAALGDGPDTAFHFALDEAVAGSGYELLYADSNHNRDLTDESPLRLTTWEVQAGFKPIRLLVPLGGSRVLCQVALLVGEGEPVPTYRLQSAGYYSGEARFGVKRYPLALVDENANGRFNDFGDPRTGETGDLLLLDVDGDGKFDTDTFAGPEARPCARYAQVDGRYYELEVSADGATFAAVPATVKLATLRSGYSSFALLLASEHGTLTVRGENGRTPLPLGDYRIMGWQIQQRAADGSLWTAQGGRPSGDGSTLSVKADTVLPRLAAPLVARLEVIRFAGREFMFSLRFSTASGEVVREVSRGGRRMPEPRLKIVDARGKEVAGIPFHYG